MLNVPKSATGERNEIGKLTADLAEKLCIHPSRVLFVKQDPKDGAKRRMTFEIIGENPVKAAALYEGLTAAKAALCKQLSDSYSMNVGISVQSPIKKEIVNLVPCSPVLVQSATSFATGTEAFLKTTVPLTQRGDNCQPAEAATDSGKQRTQLSLIMPPRIADGTRKWNERNERGKRELSAWEREGGWERGRAEDGQCAADDVERLEKQFKILQLKTQIATELQGEDGQRTAEDVERLEKKLKILQLKTKLEEELQEFETINSNHPSRASHAWNPMSSFSYEKDLSSASIVSSFTTNRYNASKVNKSNANRSYSQIDDDMYILAKEQTERRSILSGNIKYHDRPAPARNIFDSLNQSTPPPANIYEFLLMESKSR